MVREGCLRDSQTVNWGQTRMERRGEVVQHHREGQAIDMEEHWTLVLAEHRPSATPAGL